MFIFYLLTLSVAHAAKKDVLFVTGLEGPRGEAKVYISFFNLGTRWGVNGLTLRPKHVNPPERVIHCTGHVVSSEGGES